MQIVIKIPDSKYQSILSDDYCGLLNADLYKAIKDGTPLPKGHGRILDEKDILDTENNSGGWYDLTDMPEYIAGLKAIIEADKENKDGYSN